MELTDLDTAVTLLCAAALVVGVVGVVVPVLPGLVLCWLGVVAWAVLSDGGWSKWVVGALATLIALTGTVAKYLWPGRNLKAAGVPNRSLILGGLLGIVGFFVIPVVGLLIGFILGIFASEWLRLGSTRQAWPSTWHALKATGLSTLIELTAALAIAVVWIFGLIIA